MMSEPSRFQSDRSDVSKLQHRSKEVEGGRCGNLVQQGLNPYIV